MSVFDIGNNNKSNLNKSWVEYNDDILYMHSFKIQLAAIDIYFISKYLLGSKLK